MRQELAQSKDPLDYTKLPPAHLTADMTTQEVTGPHPGYGATADDMKRLIWLWLLTAAGGFVTFVVLRLLDEQLGFLGVVGAGVVTALYAAKLLKNRKAPDWQVRTAILAPVPLSVVFGLLAKLCYYPGFGVMTLGLPAFGLMLLLVHRVSRHHGLWYTAIPSVNLDDRKRWRDVINGRGPWAERGTYYLLMGTSVGLFIAAVVFCNSFFGCQLRTLCWFALFAVVLSYALSYLTKLDYREDTPAHSLVAIHNFISYNRHDCRAPGVWQSPYGSQFRRLTFTTCVLFFLSFAFAASALGAYTPTGYGRVILTAALNGEGFPIYMVLSTPFAALLPGAVILCVAHLVASPRLNSIDRELGHMWFADKACPGYAFLQRTVKLQSSENVVQWNGETIREADHLTIGRALAGDYPMLVHSTIIDEHVQIIGGSGSGKTSRAVAPLCKQRMQHGNALVFLDLKGSDDTMAAMLSDAALVNGYMKHFTLDPNRHTFAWNPFLEPFFQKLDPAGRALYLVKALSLDSGEGYGRSFFSESNLSLLRLLLTEFPDAKSFRELSEAAQNLKSFRAATADEVENARQVLMVIRTLAAIPALNVTEANAPPGVFESRIQLAALVQSVAPGGVRAHVYFHLSALKNDMAARHVARLVIFGVLAVAADRGPEDTAHVDIATDEAQRIATPETLDLLLQQSRSFKVSTILAHQSLGDLRKPSGDLTKTVFNNTRLRICFGVADTEDMQTLIRASAEAAYESPSWAVAEEDLQAGKLGMDRNRSLLTRVNTSAAPRLGPKDMMRMTDDKELAWVNVQRGAGYTRFGGEPLIVRMPFYIDPHQFEYFKKLPWPQSPGSFVPAVLELAAEPTMELPPWLASGIPGAAPLPAIPAASSMEAFEALGRSRPAASDDTTPASKRGRGKKSAEEPAAETVAEEVKRDAEVAPSPPIDTPAEPAPLLEVVEPQPVAEAPVVTPTALVDVAAEPSAEVASTPSSEDRIVLPLDLSAIDIIGHTVPTKKRGRPKKSAAVVEPDADVMPLPGMGEASPFGSTANAKGR